MLKVTLDFVSNYLGTLSKGKMVGEQKMLSAQAIAVSVLSVQDVSSGVRCHRQRPLLVVRDGKSRPEDIRQVSAGLVMEKM
jgi:hypothetical protein